MPLILAIEPDRRQAQHLSSIARRLRAELVLAESAERGLGAIDGRVPDLILTPALLSWKDDAAITDRLRELGARAAHVQTLTIPILRESSQARPRQGGMLSKLRRGKRDEPGADGCSPDMFGDQVAVYLERAAEAATHAEAMRAAHSPVVEPVPRTPEPVVPPLVTASGPIESFDTTESSVHAVGVSPVSAAQSLAAPSGQITESFGAVPEAIVESFGAAERVDESFAAAPESEARSFTAAPEPVAEPFATAAEPVVASLETPQPVDEKFAAACEPIVESFAAASEPIARSSTAAPEPVAESRAAACEPIVPPFVAPAPADASGTAGPEPAAELCSPAAEPAHEPLAADAERIAAYVVTPERLEELFAVTRSVDQPLAAAPEPEAESFTATTDTVVDAPVSTSELVLGSYASTSAMPVEPATGSALGIPTEPAAGWQYLPGALRAPRTAMRPDERVQDFRTGPHSGPIAAAAEQVHDPVSLAALLAALEEAIRRPDDPLTEGAARGEHAAAPLDAMARGVGAMHTAAELDAEESGRGFDVTSLRDVASLRGLVSRPGPEPAPLAAESQDEVPPETAPAEKPQAEPDAEPTADESWISVPIDELVEEPQLANAVAVDDDLIWVLPPLSEVKASLATPLASRHVASTIFDPPGDEILRADPAAAPDAEVAPPSNVVVPAPDLAIEALGHEVPAPPVEAEAATAAAPVELLASVAQDAQAPAAVEARAEAQADRDAASMDAEPSAPPTTTSRSESAGSRWRRWWRGAAPRPAPEETLDALPDAQPVAPVEPQAEPPIDVQAAVNAAFTAALEAKAAAAPHTDAVAGAQREVVPQTAPEHVDPLPAAPPAAAVNETAVDAQTLHALGPQAQLAPDAHAPAAALVDVQPSVSVDVHAMADMDAQSIAAVDVHAKSAVDEQAAVPVDAPATPPVELVAPAPLHAHARVPIETEAPTSVDVLEQAAADAQAAVSAALAAALAAEAAAPSPSDIGTPAAAAALPDVLPVAESSASAHPGPMPAMEGQPASPVEAHWTAPVEIHPAASMKSHTAAFEEMHAAPHDVRAAGPPQVEVATAVDVRASAHVETEDAPPVAPLHEEAMAPVAAQSATPGASQPAARGARRSAAPVVPKPAAAPRVTPAPTERTAKAHPPAEPTPVVNPQAAAPADADRTRLPSNATKRTTSKKASPKKPKPVQDEWGFFDPEQCGFAALVNKLDEITEEEEADDETKVRIVAY